jgi:transcriptional regulator with XRE-family HTH domain
LAAVKRPKSEKSKQRIKEAKEKIKRRMAELEKYTGLNQVDIASNCDVTVQTINAIYHGESDIQESTIMMLAKEGFGIEDHEFLKEGLFPEHIKMKKPYSKPKKKKNENPD